jgi:hypothetical protein
MRKPRPIVFSLQEITITREGDSANIEYKDPAYGTTHLTIGPEVEAMTDQEIMDLYNDTLKAQAELAMKPWMATEIPLGSPQIEYSERCNQWSARGHVLRCLVDDTADGEREPVIEVDGKELTWHAFGKMIVSFAGWGMRIEFTPEDETHRRPKLVVKEPESK